MFLLFENLHRLTEGGEMHADSLAWVSTIVWSEFRCDSGCEGTKVVFANSLILVQVALISVAINVLGATEMCSA